VECPCLSDKRLMCEEEESNADGHEDATGCVQCPADHCRENTTKSQERTIK